MARIDNVKRITVEDVSDEAKEAVGAVANYYNYFAEQVTNVLNGEVDFENLNRTLLTLELTLDSNNLPITTTRFGGDVGLKGINVIRVDNLTNAAIFPSGSPFITFTSSGDGFYQIQHVAGLAALGNYRLVFELIY